MGIGWDTIRVVVSLCGSPDRLLELVRRSTDAAYFSVLSRDGVTWPGRENGAPPWTAVRPGGEALLAASTAALPAKDEQLAAAIAAHSAELNEEWCFDVDPGVDHERLYFHLSSVEDTPAGEALRQLYARDHALLLTWLECGWTCKYHCDFGFSGSESLGVLIEAYELGGDMLRFSFLRHGCSFAFDDPYWRPYEAVAALFADVRCTIVVQPHGGFDMFELAVMRDGVPETIDGYFGQYSENEEQELWYRLEELLTEPEKGAADRKPDAAGAVPHRCFSFSHFCALGAAYEPGVRAALREFDAAAERRMCAHRNHFKHAGAVIRRAYHRAQTDPAHAMCRRRLTKLFNEQ